MYVMCESIQKRKELCYVIFFVANSNLFFKCAGRGCLVNCLERTKQPHRLHGCHTNGVWAKLKRLAHASSRWTDQLNLLSKLRDLAVSAEHSVMSPSTIWS